MTTDNITTLLSFCQTYGTEILELHGYEVRIESILQQNQERQRELSLSRLYDQIYPLLEK